MAVGDDGELEVGALVDGEAAPKLETVNLEARHRRTRPRRRVCLSVPILASFRARLRRPVAHRWSTTRGSTPAGRTSSSWSLRLSTPFLSSQTVFLLHTFAPASLADSLVDSFTWRISERAFL